MPLDSDIKVKSCELYFLPVQTRVPLKFGSETLTEVTCARAKVTVENRKGQTAEGWGETPLSVQWVWPSKIPYRLRHDCLKSFVSRLPDAWVDFDSRGHALELGYDFQTSLLKPLLDDFNREHPELDDPMTWLAALVCCSVIDQAVHDAFGCLVGLPVFRTYDKLWMNHDLTRYFGNDFHTDTGFTNLYPNDYFLREPKTSLLAWHLVGGLDPIDETDLNGDEPSDGYPVLLSDWILRDELKCLKIKLRGNDTDWDLGRMIRVGEMAIRLGVDWLSADFNCTVQESDYVNQILDRLRDQHSRLYGMILYVEQPFPYELEENPINVRSVSARKPLYLDESAHDWRHVKRGYELGWSGVALKTCKTQTGAVLSACWARHHGMELMVQDLTNPMLAQIPHVTLAANVGTIMGVETNAMQFYPEASNPEAKVHPGLYRREKGHVNLHTLGNTGFGYQQKRIERSLPAPSVIVAERK